MASVFIVLVTWQTLQTPTIGLTMDNYGVIEEIDPTTRNQNVVQPGDQILRIDGIPLSLIQRGETGGRGAGEQLPVVVRRGAAEIPVLLMVAVPSGTARVEQLVLVLIGWALMCLALVILFSSHALRDPLMTLFALCLTLGAIFFATMDLTGRYVIGVAIINQAVLPFAAMSLLHVNLAFSRRVWWKRPLILAGYATAALIALVYARHRVFEVQVQPWYETFSAFVQGYLLLCFALCAISLVWAWRQGEPASRRRLRLIGGGTFLATSLIVGFVLAALSLPTQSNLLYRLAAWSTLLIPAAYAMALIRRDLFALDLVLHRLLTYVVLALSLFGLYLILAWGVARFAPGGGEFTGGLLVIGLASLAQPLRRVIEHVVDRYVYGTLYNYRATIQQAVSRLSRFQSTDLTAVLTDEIPRALGVHPAHTSLWLVDRESTGGFHRIGEDLHLASVGPRLSLNSTALAQVRSAEPTMVLSRGDWPWLDGDVRWVVPLVVQEELQALWLIGPRDGDAPYSPADRELLHTIGQTAALVVMGSQLVAERDQQLAESDAARSELSRAYQQLARVQEEERRHLSRELHDEVLQGVVGIRSLLEQATGSAQGDLAQRALAALQEYVPKLVGSLRSICEGLRPAVLVHAGLEPAIQSLAADLRQDDIEVVEDIHVSISKMDEAEQTQLYRIVQEALVNIRKHASATRVLLSLLVTAEQLHLTISDDGRGFDPAQVTGGRYGLLGLRERALALGATLSITASPGEGTTIVMTR